MNVTRWTTVLLLTFFLGGVGTGLGLWTHHAFIAKPHPGAPAMTDPPDAEKVDASKNEGEKRDLEGDMKVHLVNVCLQGDKVFASTEKGMYRAGLDKKRWAKLQGESVPEPAPATDS
jgi:hypothetical protein